MFLLFRKQENKLKKDGDLFMAKKENLKYEIKEILGVASVQEDLRSNWCKAVIKTLMDNGDGEVEGLDIRRINVENNTMSTGLRLTPEEANNVTNILLENGYGSFDVLEKEYSKRKGLFDGSSTTDTDSDE